VVGHFPSVDVLGSVSRVASKVLPREQTAMATALRSVLAARRTAQDLLDVGAYQRGTNRLVDAAVDNEAAINAFLQQRMDDGRSSADAWQRLAALCHTLGVPA
jgi:flagellum-specific ATP synthase